VPYIDHVDLVVSSFERSLEFYRGLLVPLGWRWLNEVEGERGETIQYVFRKDGRGSIGLRAAQSGADSPYDRYSVGLHHLAVNAGSRRAVDRVAAWAREQNAAIESGPREYGYSPAYYAVFLHDPDGLKLEVLSRPRLRTVLWALNPATSPFRSSSPRRRR
jgi:catechol 2,3-dioxygenase-like lactoylglutathione lyase family enzyme